MSYTEVINEETMKFIQKSTELILQFRDFDKHTYKMQYGKGTITQETNQEKTNNQQQSGDNLYDNEFQLINQTFFGFIRKHAQNFQNWTVPEQKELTIEIFGQSKIAQANQQSSFFSDLNQNFQQNPMSQGGGINQQNQGNQLQQQESYKMEEWRFVFRHLNNEEESSNQIQRVMNPQQFVMNLSILTRSILSLLTNMPIFKCRDFLKTSRRVHFTKGTVKEFNLQFQKIPLKIETFTKKIYLLHHVFEFQIRYLIEQEENIFKMSAESPRFAGDQKKQPQLQMQHMSSFSIYSHIDSSQQSFANTVINEMSKQQSNVEKVDNPQKESLKQSSNTTNQSIFDMDFSSISSLSPRNTYSPPNFAQIRAQGPPKKYSEDLSLFKKNLQQIPPQLIQKDVSRDKANTIQRDKIEDEDFILKIGRRNTECQNKKDPLGEQLDVLLQKLTIVGDPFYQNKESRSVQDVLQSILT